MSFDSGFPKLLALDSDRGLLGLMKSRYKCWLSRAEVLLADFGEHFSATGEEQIYSSESSKKSLSAPEVTEKRDGA